MLSGLRKFGHPELGASGKAISRCCFMYALKIGPNAGLGCTVLQPIKQITDRDRDDQQKQYERPIRLPDNQ